MKKFCTKCGHEFEAVGREVICPACKEHAAVEAKRAAVLRAKKASWTGESVPVRISGRASAVIREYGQVNNMPFAQALDDLLKASDYFKSTGATWESVEPYKSHRRDKATSKPQDVPQEAPQATSKPQEVTKAAGKPQEAPQATQAAKASKTTSKTAASKSSSKSSKASKSASK